MLEKEIVVDSHPTLKPKAHVIFLGRDGAGKSTITRLLEKEVAYSALIHSRPTNPSDIERTMNKIFISLSPEYLLWDRIGIIDSPIYEGRNIEPDDIEFLRDNNVVCVFLERDDTDTSTERGEKLRDLEWRYLQAMSILKYFNIPVIHEVIQPTPIPEDGIKETLSNIINKLKEGGFVE